MNNINTTIYVPQKIKVGFDNRKDTYTGKLAYVIYYDEKGKLRKEASWNSWRNKSIDPVEYENEPTSGFVLNKKVGDYAGDWGAHRQAYCRIYDPRGFEFNTFHNHYLLYISRVTLVSTYNAFPHPDSYTHRMCVAVDTPHCFYMLSSLYLFRDILLLSLIY